MVSSTVVDPVPGNALAVWRNLWDDSDDLPRHALGVLHTGMCAIASNGMH